MLVLGKLAECWSKIFKVVEDCGSARSVDGKVFSRWPLASLSIHPSALAMVFHLLSTCWSIRQPLSNRSHAEYSKIHYIPIY